MIGLILATIAVGAWLLLGRSEAPAAVIETPAPSSAAVSRTPAPVTTAVPAESEDSAAPSAPTASWPNGYDILFCAAYGRFTSATKDGGESLREALHEYGAGIQSASSVVRTIKSFRADVLQADKELRTLPKWSPATATVSNFRKALAAWKEALDFYSAGISKTNQRTFDKGTTSLSKVDAPMTRGYSGAAALGANYGLRCDEDGFAPPDVNQPETPKTVDLATGKSMNAGTQRVTLQSIETWPGNSLLPPDPGMLYVTLQLRIDALKATTVAPFLIKVQAKDGAVYSPSFILGREPALAGIDLPAGGFESGYVTFELPAASTSALTLLYSAGLGEPTVRGRLPAP